MNFLDMWFIASDYQNGSLEKIKYLSKFPLMFIFDFSSKLEYIYPVRKCPIAYFGAGFYYEVEDLMPRTSFLTGFIPCWD